MARHKRQTRVYSYIRFSTPEQSMGHSEQRQLKAAEEWVKRKGLLFDSQLTDRGLSGYHGHHRTKGVLGDFLKQVEDGLVPPGSILLVENIDRLGREAPKQVLQNIIFKLWEHNITLQTLSPEMTFEPGCDSDHRFMPLLFSIQRAQEESQRKSDLIRKARMNSFAKARKDGTIVTSKCPAWLEVHEGKFRPIPEAEETIALIFDLKLRGLSQRKIESTLNAEAKWLPPPRKKKERDAGLPSNGWRTSYIKKILSNRAVIGEYQPHHRVDGVRTPEGEPITGYYPLVVRPEVFRAVNDQLDANRGKGGRVGKRRNVFAHLAKCGYCGGPMRFVDSGEPAWRYLVCDRHKRGLDCEGKGVRYAEAIDEVLHGCVYLRPEQVLPATDEQTKEINALRQEIKDVDLEVADLEKQAENLFGLIKRTALTERQDMYAAEHEKLLGKIEALSESAEAKRRKLAHAESGAKRFKNWKKTLPSLVEAISDEDAAELRYRLAAHLREFIERIEIFPVGFKVLADRGEHYVRELGEVLVTASGRRRRRHCKSGWLEHVETVVELLDAAFSDIESPPPMRQIVAFERYVFERRMSKEGRFYRVLFKTGERVDLVPPGGLATGYSNVGKSLKEVWPDFAALWDDFEKSQSNKAVKRTG